MDAALEAFHGLPEPRIGAMLGQNAAHFFGFDNAKRPMLVARIGPEKSRFVE